jgi:hypothetical protein
MPADAAMVSTPPGEHEGYMDGRCPPEESRMHSLTPLIEQQLSSANDDGSRLDIPAQLPTPPPNERASPPRVFSPPEPHTKPLEVTIEARSRGKLTTGSATDDGAKEQQKAQASPPSATASSLMSWPEHNYLTSPRPNHRVCTTSVAMNMLARKRSCY